MMEAMRQRLQQQGGFQNVDPTAAGGAQGATAIPGAEGGLEANIAASMGGALGDASSSDAFLIGGTVGRGGSAGGDMGMFAGFGGFGGPGGVAGASQEGGFPGQSGGPDASGMAERLAMVVGMMGGAGPGGPGGARGGQGAPGSPGGARGQGQGQRRPGGEGGEGPRIQFGEGNALAGMQRIMRQTINRVRFSFFERFGTSAWDARPYSLTAQNPEKLNTYRNRFGISLGGPMVLPKIYDGRDKTFFFLNYNGNYSTSAIDSFSTVPLLEERMGDFSTRGLQLFDPFSNLIGPRTPLGSVIPAGMLDPAALGLLQFIPEPNLPGLVQNFHLQATVPNSSHMVNFRIMHTISPKLNLQVSYNLNSSHSRSVANVPELRSRGSGLGQNATIGFTQQFSQRFNHNSQLNWTRQRNDSLSRFAFTQDIAGGLGITGISTDPVNWGVPQINYTNFVDLNDPIPSLRRNQTVRYTDSLMYARGKHTLRAGGEVRRMQNNLRTDPTARGLFTFTGLMTADLDANRQPVAGTGWDFADFLLGLPQSTNVRFGSTSTYFRNWGLSGFVQDDWRIHPRFSAQIGVRYEFFTPLVERYDKIANLDVDDAITAVAVVLPGQTAPFSGIIGRALIKPDNNNWSPRVGIAWRPKVKMATTVRAGYGVFYNNSIYTQLAFSMANQPPHANAQTLLTSSAQVLTLVNGFPVVPVGDVSNTIAVDPDYRVGYAQIWNFSVQTQVTRNWNAEVVYTGTKGTHLDLFRSPNRALPGGPLGTEFNRRIPNAPGFTYDTYGASSIYHALRATLQRRFAGGLMVRSQYTFGKSLDNASSIGGGAQVVVQDDNNFDAERGRSSFDVRHQFTTFFMVELPFGERRRWAKRGWQAAWFGEWSLNGNVTLNAGTPFTARVLGSAANNSGTGNSFSERPDQVGDPNLPRDQRTIARWFNTDAFALPAPGVFGNASRNTISGPGTAQVNFSVGRGIRFGPDNRRRFDLRWEVQNLFNHPNFSGIGTVVNSTNYGRVLGARAMRSMDLSLRVSF